MALWLGTLLCLDVFNETCNHSFQVLPPNCINKQQKHTFMGTENHKQAWPRFNIKMLSYQYRKSHCGDKTVERSSYLHNGISCTGKTTSLYWIGALIATPTKIKLTRFELTNRICDCRTSKGKIIKNGASVLDPRAPNILMFMLHINWYEQFYTQSCCHI